MKKTILTIFLLFNLNGNTIIGQDKILHFVGGLTIYGSCLILNNAFNIKNSSEKCIIPVISIAFAKEYYDSLGNGHIEFNDYVATISAPILLYTLEYKF